MSPYKVSRPSGPEDGCCMLHACSATTRAGMLCVIEYSGRTSGSSWGPHMAIHALTACMQALSEAGLRSCSDLSAVAELLRMRPQALARRGRRATRARTCSSWSGASPSSCRCPSRSWTASSASCDFLARLFPALEARPAPPARLVAMRACMQCARAGMRRGDLHVWLLFVLV